MVVCVYIYISGWWLTYPSEKYEFVSWDDEIDVLTKLNGIILKCGIFQTMFDYVPLLKKSIIIFV